MKATGTLVVMMIFSVQSFSQAISLDQNDFANAGDTVRLSVGLPNPLFNVSATGANYTWNHGNLVAASQRVDTFRTVASTDPIYSFVFANIALNPNRANIAATGTDFPAAGGLSISDVYNFFYKTNTNYKQVGLGAKINGITTPVPFSSHDTLYAFPVNFGGTDSSNSGFTINLPNLLYYGYSQKRVNIVDGWGMLTIPFGSFPVLRVKSIITSSDTLYIDSLAQGFNITRPVVTEYKWIGKQQEVPLLQVNTQTFFSQQIVTSIVYRDSARSLVSVGEMPSPVQALKVFPNPVVDVVLVTFNLRESLAITWKLIDINGRLVRNEYRGVLAAGPQLFAIDGLSKLAAGNYLLQLCTVGECALTKITLSENR